MASKKCFDDQWIVITGGAGFVGSCVVRQLNDLGYDKNIIIVDDIEERGKWRNLSGKKFSEVISVDEFGEWLIHNKDEIEAIVHLASATNEREMFHTSYRAPVELASFAVDYNVRFIYASSGQTYGYGRNGFDDDHTKLDSLRQQSDLPGIKHLFDLWALRNKCLDRIVGLKFADVYGPNEYHKETNASVILKAYRQAQAEGKIETASLIDPALPNSHMKDLVYVKDVARIVCEFLFHDTCGIFNVGSGEATSLKQIAEIVNTHLDKPVEIIESETPPPLDGVEQFTLNLEKLSSIMPPPSTKLNNGVKDYIENYLPSKDHW